MFDDRGGIRDDRVQPICERRRREHRAVDRASRRARLRERRSRPRSYSFFVQLCRYPPPANVTVGREVEFEVPSSPLPLGGFGFLA